MMEGMGTQFDPNMLLVFQPCRDKLERYYTFFGQDQPEDRTETRAS